MCRVAPEPWEAYSTVADFVGCLTCLSKNLPVFLYCTFFFSFLGPYPWYMEVPRPGVKSELQLPAYTTATARQIRDASATYTTAQGDARSLTH